MKLNKKIFSLAMSVPIPSSILAKSPHTTKVFNNPNNYDKTFGLINEDIEINHI